jgi:hypothetical protein
LPLGVAGIICSACSNVTALRSVGLVLGIVAMGLSLVALVVIATLLNQGAQK